MIRKCLSVLLAVTLVMSVFAVLPVTTNAREVDIANDGANIELAETGITQSEFDSKLSNLRGQYPNYSTWYGSFDGGIQCFGFARLVAYNVFGSHVYDWDISYSMDGVKAGDVLQYGPTSGSGHTVFVTSVSGDTVYFVDCNGNGNYSGGKEVRSCGIKWDNSINKWGKMFGSIGFSYRHISPTIDYIPDNLRVGVNGSHAYLSWDWDGNADYYNVKLWRGKVWEGDPYHVIWSVKSNNYGFALPKGTYQAYVDACNDNSGYCKMSNVITFTIGDSVVNLNADVSGSYVGLTWNRDSNAQYYNLKIWKNYVWEGEAYETVWKIKDTSRYLALPKGTYQAFVDAVNENTNYCSMSSVVAFTVGDSGVNLNADVSGSYVGLTWNRDSKAQYYNLKIWKNYVWEGEAYETVWKIKDTSRYLALPKGTYQAFVDAVNENTNYCSMSSVVAFTVGDSGVNMNADVSGSYVGLTWNRDSKAQYYNLKIWKNYVWEGEAYETVWKINDTSRYLALPKGTYQAFVDAVNENTNYCTMSSVVAFTVGDSGVNLNASVSDPQVSFSWNRDNNAQYYNLKIWKNYVWEGETYETVWKIKDTNISLNFPKGTYQAFVDAVNENTNYCSMSSVVAFTVEQGIEPTTPTEQPTVPTEPISIPTEPTVVPTEPPTTPIEQPTTPPTEPTIPTEPVTTPTELPTIPTEPKIIILGDVDGDGAVTILDATAIQRHLVNLATKAYFEKAADADGDGEVTILDATAIQRHIASLPTNENIGKEVG